MNAEVNRVQVMGFNFGIFLSHSSNNDINDNAVSGSTGQGIRLDSSSGNEVHRNLLDTNSIGLTLATDGNTISANVAINGQNILAGTLFTAGNNKIEGNTVASNPAGIFVNGSGNQITGNTVLFNTFFDLQDEQGCPSPNTWENNFFNTSIPPQPSCIQ
jgi:parallel beta-helix repeat protein